ncbi:hypothetical protein GCM10009676_20510 [Prauserella halophila]|uniref:Excreted virulence factor EspC (Type VII ESX diderm) n=1 Tax=Prauserella halophila TaxID=185641 RepID=A0ABN1W7M8_9PSEU|nr:hypothetical protein [Prauserella halophila]MCP2235755.1 hypothetical protein [Prauserella halophila]
MPEFDQPIPAPTTDSGQDQGGLWAKVNPFNAESMAKAEKQSGELLESAKGGGFRVSENAGKDLQDAITEALGDLDEIMYEADGLAEEPKLGTGPYAKQVAQHVQQSGNGPRGILPMLRKLRTVLEQSEEALKIAMRNYHEAEEQQKQTFRQ